MIYTLILEPGELARYVRFVSITGLAVFLLPTVFLSVMFLDLSCKIHVIQVQHFSARWTKPSKSKSSHNIQWQFELELLRLAMDISNTASKWNAAIVILFLNMLDYIINNILNLIADRQAITVLWVLGISVTVFGVIIIMFRPICNLNLICGRVIRRVLVYQSLLPPARWGSTSMLQSFESEEGTTKPAHNNSSQDNKIAKSVFCTNLDLTFNVYGIKVTYRLLLQIGYILGGIMLFLLGQTSVFKGINFTSIS